LRDISFTEGEKMTKDMTFQIIALVGAVCGLLMVGGGIMLLRVGAISLSDTAKKGAFALQIRKDIKITTSYPALGIFVIGIIFLALSLYMTKPEVEIPLRILGHLNVSDPGSFRVRVEPDQMGISDGLDSTGKFDKIMHPHITTVKVTLTASGYEPESETRQLEITPGFLGQQPTVKLPDDFKFTKIKAKPEAGDVKPVATGEKLQPLNAPASF
jgi:hypothetical protein